MVKYTPLPEGVPEGSSPRELLKAKGYSRPYIPSQVLIRTVYHFNSHKANNFLITLSNYSAHPRECTVKFTPCLQVILKELNLCIPSFIMIYCCIYKFCCLCFYFFTFFRSV